MQNVHGTRVQRYTTRPPSQGTARIWSAQVALLPRFYLTKTRWAPYAEAGVFGTYLFHLDAGDLRYGGTRLGDLIEGEGILPRLQPGVAAGVGVERQRIAIGVRFERTALFRVGDTFRTPIANLLVTASYRL